MNRSIDRLLSLLIGLAALAVIGGEVRRFFVPDGGRPRPRKSEYMSNWRDVIPVSRSMGDAVAPVTLVEFTDFQCPYCRLFDSVVTNLQTRYPGKIGIAVVHLPLQGHTLAEPAGIAVECSYQQGRFAEAVHFMFAHQRELGTRPWTFFATGAGVADTTKFLRCMEDPGARSFVQAGAALGEKLEIRATPTVILNGWRYGVAPVDSELDRAIADILGGKAPYKGYPPTAIPKTNNGRQIVETTP